MVNCWFSAPCPRSRFLAFPGSDPSEVPPESLRGLALPQPVLRFDLRWSQVGIVSARGTSPSQGPAREPDGAKAVLGDGSGGIGN